MLQGRYSKCFFLRYSCSLKKCVRGPMSSWICAEPICGTDLRRFGRGKIQTSHATRIFRPTFRTRPQDRNSSVDYQSVLTGSPVVLHIDNLCLRPQAMHPAVPAWIHMILRTKHYKKTDKHIRDMLPVCRVQATGGDDVALIASLLPR